MGQLAVSIDMILSGEKELSFSPMPMIRSLFQGFLVNVGLPLSRISVNVQGSFPESGPFIIAANHSSHLDTVIILKGLSHRGKSGLKIAASRGYFFQSNSPLHRLAVSLFNLIPATGHDLIRSLNVLRRNEESLLIYPEGTRSRSGKIGSFCHGVGRMHRDSSIPVIPVAIRGTFDLMPAGSKWPKAGSVDLIIGNPVISCETDSVKITETIESQVRMLSAIETES